MIRKYTILLILITIVAWGVWDVYAYMSADNSSISVVITDWSRIVPSISFVIGCLCGHWFFPARGSVDD